MPSFINLFRPLTTATHRWAYLLEDYKVLLFGALGTPKAYISRIVFWKVTFTRENEFEELLIARSPSLVDFHAHLLLHRE